MNRWLPFISACLLAACGGPTLPAETTPAEATQAETTVAAAAAEVASAATPPGGVQARSLGYYSQGDTRIELRDLVWLPAEPGEVALLLAPTELSVEEREQIMVPGSFPGMPLLGKRVDEYGDRYPFVVVKLKVEEAGGVSQVRHYYVMAQAIREANYTDNLNGFPNETHPLQWEVAADGTRRLRFSGEDELGGEMRRWEFDIAG